MSAGYEPVPTDDPEYPPRSGWVQRAPRGRWRLPRVVLWAIGAALAVHYAVLLVSSVGGAEIAFRSSPSGVEDEESVEEEVAQPLRPLPEPSIDCIAPAVDFGPSDTPSNLSRSAAADLLGALALGPGAMMRDATPIATAQHFLALAEAEVAAQKRDTCGDELGRKLLQDAARGRVVWCAADDAAAHLNDVVEVDTLFPGSEGADNLEAAAAAPPRVECMPIRVPWWPARSVPCVSRHLRPIHRIQQRQFLAPGCARTRAGHEATVDAAPPFIGRQIVQEGEPGDNPPKCDVVLGHTVVFIQRQDRWNPFHVAEDLVMTLTSMLIAGAAVPSLAQQRVQLAFLDETLVEGDRFAAIWERIGAVPPRRTRVEPYPDGTCLTTAIHGVFGLRSLFSAQGVNKPYMCASTLTWAASHYFRHLFGLLPRTTIDGTPVPARAAMGPPRTINVLYLSRATLKGHLKEDFGDWQKQRELLNEDQLMAQLRRGLHQLCAGKREVHQGETLEALECVFQDADARPETWLETPSDTRPHVRFASMDPTGHALETQIHLAGHTDILIGQHGGALGLSLFMHPGAGAMLELAVPLVRRSEHFQHMAVEMGHDYTRVDISRSVDPYEVWTKLRAAVLKQATQAQQS